MTEIALLAQIPQPTPGDIGTWLLVFALVASIIGNIAGILRGGRAKMEVMPQPVQVELAEKFQSRESAAHQDRRIEHVERRIEHIENIINTGFSELREAIAKSQVLDEERARRIHNRIDNLSVSLSEKIGKLQGHIERT